MWHDELGRRYTSSVNISPGGNADESGDGAGNDKSSECSTDVYVVLPKNSASTETLEFPEPDEEIELRRRSRDGKVESAHVVVAEIEWYPNRAVGRIVWK